MNNINSKCVSELFWQGGSSRPEAAAEGRETTEVKEETYVSCIVLNFSYYEAPTFYNIKRIEKTVPCHERALDLGSNNNILFFVFKRRELCKCVVRVIRNISLIVCGYWYLCNKPCSKIWNVAELKDPLELS
jgi:hypothetical protein